MRERDVHSAEWRSLLESIATPFDDLAWRAAEPCFRVRSFQEREPVISAGDRVGHLLFVLDGLARYYYLDPDGREHNKSFATRGQVLSSVSSLISGQPSPFHVQALTPLRCLSISHRDMIDLSESHAAWNRVRITLLEQLVIKKEQREADFLLLSAEARYRKFLAHFAHLEHQLPNFHIASYIGVTEVGLSRIRRRLGLTRVNDG